MTYRTLIRRTTDNPLTGSAQYVVVDSWMESFHTEKMVYPDIYFVKMWRLKTERLYRRGTFINPRKALGIEKAPK